MKQARYKDEISSSVVLIRRQKPISFYICVLFC